MSAMNPATDLFVNEPVSPFLETGAYEAIWAEDDKASFKKVYELLNNGPIATRPSDIVDHDKSISYAKRVWDRFVQRGLKNVGVRIRGTLDYIRGLYDVEYQVELLYYQGNWDYVYYPNLVAVVGSRKMSEEGKLRTIKLVDYLVKEHNCGIVSGLAAGIDRTAHMRAIQNHAVTIGVIGTPLTDVYPRQNRDLQEFIAKNFLLISQIPVERYYKQDFRLNRFFFPERNKVMSAISRATFIVEASDTSGSLVQARAAIKQKRKLFILQSCFDNPSISWPARFEKMGAIRIRDFEDIDRNLFSDESQSA